MDYQNTRKNIEILRDKLLEALVHLEEIEQKVQFLSEDMYPSVPREQWQDRNGCGRYLYMLFRLDSRTGEYQGPDGKRKLYVGNDPKKISSARQRVKNRRCYEELTRVRDRLLVWLRDRLWAGSYPRAWD